MESEVIDYVVEYFQDFMTDAEREALFGVHVRPCGCHHRKKVVGAGPYYQSPEVQRLLDLGRDRAREVVAERLLRDQAPLVVLNRCPSCGALARCPNARQCRRCGHDWH